ncbi:hypothetical protein [Winogradskyella eximia]|nr:hypothetical protein [Winogradskyella eximia]
MKSKLTNDHLEMIQRALKIEEMQNKIIEIYKSKLRQQNNN